MDKPISIAELNNYIKSQIEADPILTNVFVKGEISNFKDYKVGGHWYFSLKDSEAQINCVVFSGVTERIKFKPEDGMSVIAKGKVSVWNKRGTYNLQVFYMEPEGIGDLAKAFEQLKEKLFKEGLFADEHKKRLPQFPKRIAIAAAESGAAVHDVINIATRRNPGIELVLLPTIVQGEKGEDSIVNSIKIANEFDDLDLLILARGGGSMEDLWYFNEEKVARAIFDSKLPIVSAVGHEVDYTIADFVADLRAPTPSAAAELVVPDIEEWRQKLLGTRDMLMKSFNNLITDQYQELDYLQERLNNSFLNIYKDSNNRLQNLTERLEALNPLAVLKRGYAVVKKGEEYISSAKKLKSKDKVAITFVDGDVGAEIE